MKNLGRLSVFLVFLLGLVFSLKAEARCEPILLMKSSLAAYNKSFTGPEELLREAARVLKRSLDQNQSEAILKAHFVGLGAIGKDKIHDAGVDNFTRSQLAIKARILRSAGFTISDVRALMENRIVGFEIFLAGYGAARLGMDLWDYFTYSPKTVLSLQKDFSKQKTDSSNIRNPKDLFKEIFEDFMHSDDEDRVYVYPIGSQIASHEYTIWKRKFDRHEQTAFLIKNSNGSEELLVGRVEPIATTDQIERGKFNKIVLHTNEGQRSFAVADILIHTVLDLRSRVKAFVDTFKEYDPKAIWYNADKADLEKTNEIQFHIEQYKNEVNHVQRLKDRGAQVALLSKNEDGSQKLVVGRMDYETSFHGRPKIKTRQVPNPRTGWFEPKMIDQRYEDPNDLIGGHVIEFFIITTADGKIERIPYKSVLRFTGIDLRVRMHLFAKEFKEFKTAGTAYDPVNIVRAVKDHIRYMGTDSSSLMSQYYHEAMRAFESKDPIALLVQRKDGSHSLVVGVPEPVLAQVQSQKNILTGLKVKRIDDGKTEELSLADILNYTTKSVRNHSGVNIISLIKLFEAMPVRASSQNVQNLAKMTIYDAMNLNQKESALQVAQMNILEKLKYLKNLLGGSLNDLQKEALLQAIFIGNLPTTPEEVGQVSMVNHAYSYEIIEAKYRSLKNAGFTNDEIILIAQSGALGVGQAN